MRIRQRVVTTTLFFFIGIVVPAMGESFLEAPAASSRSLAIGTAVGQMHPDFLLPTVDGEWGRLSDYRGKKVLLVHFASW